MESWQKAAGIIPPHLCETGNTECGGDRYRDTGERGRWLAHFHSLSLSRGQGWPQHGVGAVSWHISCPSQSPLASLTRATFQTKGKVEERVMLWMSMTMCWRMCEKVSVCSHDITHSRPVANDQHPVYEVRRKWGNQWPGMIVWTGLPGP